MTVRLGIVGCGAIVESLHLPAAAQVDDIEVTALVDADVSRAELLGTQYGIAQTANELSACQDVDAILLATPPHLRVDIVQEAFRMGLHVLVEKPLANTVAECEEMRTAATASGQILAVGHVYRFWPSRQRIHDAIRTGEYGSVQHIAVSQGKPYSWASVTGYTMQRDKVPGGVLINAGTHPLDSLLWWLGDPETIDYHDDALGGLESNFRLEMSFAEGASAILEQSRTSYLKHLIHITTTDAEIDLPTYSRDRFTVHSDGGSQDVICCDDDDHLRPGVAQLQDFADAVRQGGVPKVTGEDAIHLIRVIEECYTQKRNRSLPNRAPIPGAIW